MLWSSSKILSFSSLELISHVAALAHQVAVLIHHVVVLIHRVMVLFLPVVIPWWQQKLRLVWTLLLTQPIHSPPAPPLLTRYWCNLKLNCLYFNAAGRLCQLTLCALGIYPGYSAHFQLVRPDLCGRRLVIRTLNRLRKFPQCLDFSQWKYGFFQEKDVTRDNILGFLKKCQILVFRFDIKISPGSTILYLAAQSQEAPGVRTNSLSSLKFGKSEMRILNKIIICMMFWILRYSWKIKNLPKE